MWWCLCLLCFVCFVLPFFFFFFCPLCIISQLAVCVCFEALGGCFFFCCTIIAASALRVTVSNRMGEMIAYLYIYTRIRGEDEQSPNCIIFDITMTHLANCQRRLDQPSGKTHQLWYHGTSQITWFICFQKATLDNPWFWFTGIRLKCARHHTTSLSTWDPDKSTWNRIIQYHATMSLSETTTQVLSICIHQRSKSLPAMV